MIKKNTIFIILIIITILNIIILTKFNSLIFSILKHFVYDNRKDKNKLRLVQYNTEYLYSDSKIINCPGKDCTWKNKTEQSKHFSKISQIINDLNPDIINLCEINTSEILNKLINSLDDSSSYKYYLSLSQPNFLDQNLGIITRVEPLQFYRMDGETKYPINNSKCNFSGDGIINTPKNYISHFYINNMNIIIIGVHLKAYPNKPENCAIREAQAMIIQKSIIKYYNTHEIIVIGDINDFDDDVKDYSNNNSNSKVLNIIKGKFGYNPINYKLYNTSEFLKKKERFTTDRMSMLDYVLVTEKLKKYIKDVDVFTEYEEKIGTDYDSDHYPIIVDFDFTKRIKTQ